jgi:predicted O-methyltransferase YrrM
MNLAQLDKTNWKRLTVLAVFFAAAIGGALGWLSGGEQILAGLLGAVLSALVIGPLVLLLGSLNVKINDVRDQVLKQVDEKHQAVREMVNLRPLLDGPPLDYGDWAMDPFLGKVLAQAIARHRPDYIVECGSGTSTVVMAQLLERYNPSGHVVAVDHLDEFATKTEDLVGEYGYGGNVDVLTAPLREWEVDGKRLTWYGISPTRFEERSIDLLVVDGPPWNTGPLARYPAAFILEPYLAEDCIVVLDDGDRSEEEKAAHRWAEFLDADLEYAGGPKGMYVLRC